MRSADVTVDTYQIEFRIVLLIRTRSEIEIGENRTKVLVLES